MSSPRVIRRPGAGPMGTAAKREKTSSGGKAKRVGIFLAVLLLVGLAWAFWPRQNPALARLEELRVEMENAPREKRRELFGQMREQMEQLSEEEREAFFEPRRREWEAREQKRLNDFFAMTPEQQIAHLDERIDEEEKWRKEREARRGDGGRGDRGGRGGPRGPRGPGSDPNARAKRYLDRTTAQTRAQRSEYWRMRQERRQARGLPSGGWGR